LFGQADDQAVVQVDAAFPIALQRGPDGSRILDLQRRRIQQVGEDAGDKCRAGAVTVSPSPTRFRAA
jgi:hypothetical protein